MGGPSERPRGIRVRTGCATEDEFVAMFHRNCDEASVFTPTEKDPAVGADCAFSFDLANGQPVLRGLGVVLTAWSTADNPFGARGVQIGCVQLTSQSEPVFGRLLVARATADARAEGEARPRAAPATQLLWGATPSEEPMTEDSVLVETRQTITRERAAMGDGTAAPVAPFDARSTETVRHERPLRPPAPVAPPLEPAEPSWVISSLALSASDRLAAWLAAKAARLGPARAWLAARLGPVRTRLKPWLSAVTARLSPLAGRLAAATAREFRAEHSAAHAPPIHPPLWWRNPRVAAVFALGITFGVVVSLMMRPSRGQTARSSPVAAITGEQCRPETVAMA
ncbi:MAG: hypothetical protein H0T42_07125, partial [Deltaproteobacteria bacterium]|nr:hypothetical protein [Deltaproteobacteria bacterium]